MTLAEVAAVGAGGALGALGRHGLSLWAARRLGLFLPYGTLLANLIGCFLIGWLLSLHEQGGMSDGLRLAAVVGLLGGFTTYSSFAFEAFSLMRGGRPALALGYVAASLLLGLFFVMMGWTLALELS